MTLHGSPVAREMETWWREHAGRHDDPEWRTYLADYTSLLATKMGELTSSHDNVGIGGEKRFGMSGAGSCTRKATLKYMGYESEPFSGSTQVTFHIGHLLEVLAIATLNATGHAVDGTQADVRIDPFMHSMSDGIIHNLDGRQAILSVKSTAYKMSGKQRGKWVRRGFAELPFEGVRKCQPSWWAQAQAEMEGSGIERTLLVAVSKDIVKVFEDDEWLGDRGNGSLTFYAELIEYDPVWCNRELRPIWSQAWDAATDGRAAPAFVYVPSAHKYMKLPKPGDSEAGWGGVNQATTGSYNPCGGCDLVAACKKELSKEYRR